MYLYNKIKVHWSINQYKQNGSYSNTLKTLIFQNPYKLWDLRGRFESCRGHNK